MKILITTNVFPPEARAAAIMAADLADELARSGHHVTVAAGYPYHPYGRIYPGYRRRWISRERHSCYDVIRGWHLIHPNESLPVQALVMASRCGAFCLSAFNAERPDIVIAYEGPPLVGPLTSAMIARLSRARLISVIYDIYPDIAFEMGKLNNSLLKILTSKLEKMVYCLSDHIVVLSEGFKRVLTEDKGVPPGKVTTIPFWLDSREIMPLPRTNPWRREMGITDDKFVVLYAGSIGLVSGAEVVLEAAQRLFSYSDILFVMVGEGHAKERVEAAARNLCLSNLIFFPLQPRERLSELQATADISLVTLLPGRGRTSVPSKVIGYMAAARPIIAAVDADCDTANIITKAKCGMVIPPGRGDILAEAILHYYSELSIGEVHGRNGRKYFLKYFDKKTTLNQYINMIQEII